MYEEALRQWCVEQVLRSQPGLPAHEVIREAEELMQYIRTGARA